MSLIKVNYNNAAIKKPLKILPAFFCYKYSRLGDDGIENVFCIEIDPRLQDESFYTNYFFEIYVNDVLVSYVDKNSEKNEAGRIVVELVNYDSINYDSLAVQIKGKYSDEFRTEREFVKDTLIVNDFFTPSEELYCDEHIICNDGLYGYLVDNVFYTERTGTIGAYEYDGDVDPYTFDGVFIDLASKLVYEWNSNSNEYQLLYQ